MLMKESKPEHLRSRALSDKRPIFASQCRNPSLPKQHPCRLEGHDLRFLRFDRYGCCERCGAEVLT